jgi:hypothetical protein
MEQPAWQITLRGKKQSTVTTGWAQASEGSIVYRQLSNCSSRESRPIGEKWDSVLKELSLHHFSQPQLAIDGKTNFLQRNEHTVILTVRAWQFVTEGSSVAISRIFSQNQSVTLSPSGRGTFTSVWIAIVPQIWDPMRIVEISVQQRYSVIFSGSP